MTDNNHDGDASPQQAAAPGEGLVLLTPDLLKDIQAAFQARMKDIEDNWPALVQACPYEMKLAVTAWVMEHIVDHATAGGSFRHLIYDRLGFGADAYIPLYSAGGMAISNEFVIATAGADDAALADRLKQSLWPKPEKGPVQVEGGKEPWLTICEAANRIEDLSRSLAAEQEKRRRVEDELKAAISAGSGRES